MKRIVFILIAAILLCAAGTAEAKSKVRSKSSSAATAGTYKGHTYFGKGILTAVGDNSYGTDYLKGDVQITFNSSGRSMTLKCWVYVRGKKISLGSMKNTCYQEGDRIISEQNDGPDFVLDIQDGAQSLYLEPIEQTGAEGKTIGFGGTLKCTK